MNYKIEFFDIDDAGIGDWEYSTITDNPQLMYNICADSSIEGENTFWRYRELQKEWIPSNGFWFDGIHYVPDTGE